ncbi:MAG: hypothetical protein JM58_11945 [Peptococcaceae bacterium BICA1-8]|nr:MAG: hypothetical protein JM58_11945 [Peptococcaceae bacterium BICA1-8]
MITAGTVQPILPLYDKEMECLYCNKTFITKKVRSKFIRIKKRDSDLCNHYEGINPYYYEVFVCSHCNYAFTERFQPINNICNEIIKERYIKNTALANLNGERSLEQAVKAFKLALLCATLAGESSYILAGLCLKLAWLYRYDNNNEETRFLNNALDNYIKTYEQGDIATLNKASLLYIIGELENSLGDYERARRWFSILLSDKTLDPKIVKIAKDRWQELRYERTLEEDSK